MINGDSTAEKFPALKNNGSQSTEDFGGEAVNTANRNGQTCFQIREGCWET